MSWVLVAFVIVPLVALVISGVAPRAVAAWTTVFCSLVCVGLSVALIGPATGRVVSAGGELRADALSVVFLLAAVGVYALTSVYAIGYLRVEHDTVADAAAAQRSRRRHDRLFYLGFNAFAWSLICAPLMAGMALLWVAIEVTTVVSALLITLDATVQASEAAWKYVLIASSGLGLALLATILLYFAGSQVLGESYDLAFDPLMRVGASLPHTPVRLAFLLAVVGYGTKVGLFPVHTWLPDAHAEAPTPVSALLSGALLAVCFYAILRFHQVAVRALGPDFPQNVLLVFGVLSLLLASLYLLAQRHLKRMLAYSSIEHMGIIAIGIGIGTPLAAAGVMLHVLAHAAAKANAFMCAGTIVQTYRTREIIRIRNVLGRLPWTGPLLLMAVLALSAMPPFGLFRSEFEIVAGGLSGRHTVIAAILVVLVTVAFAGFAIATTRMLFLPERYPAVPASATSAVGSAASRRHTDAGPLMIVPVVVGVLVLLALGVAPLPGLSELIGSAAAQVGGGH